MLAESIISYTESLPALPANVNELWIAIGTMRSILASTVDQAFPAVGPSSQAVSMTSTSSASSSASSSFELSSSGSSRSTSPTLSSHHHLHHPRHPWIPASPFSPAFSLSVMSSTTTAKRKRRPSLPYIRRRLQPVLSLLLILSSGIALLVAVDAFLFKQKVLAVEGVLYRPPEWMDTGWLPNGDSSWGVERILRGSRIPLEKREGEGESLAAALDRRSAAPGAHQASFFGEKKRRRVLFLTDYHDYLERMNTNTYEIVDAALRLDPASPSYALSDHHEHPLELDVDVWGPKWAGWNPQLPVSENVRRRSWKGYKRREAEKAVRLKRETKEEGWKVVKEDGGRWAETVQGLWSGGVEKVEELKDLTLGLEEKIPGKEEDVFDIFQTPGGCPSEPFDFVWTFSDIFKQNDPLLDPLPCGSVFIQQLGDCHSLNCLKEWYPNVSNITVSKYGFELVDVFSPKVLAERFPGMEMQLFGYSADSANEWDFYPLERWGDKKFDARLFGYTGSFYPIRVTITDALEHNTPTKLQRYSHPGYIIWEDPEAYSKPLDTYTEGHHAYEKHMALREDFAKAMRESRICVFDASTERKMIRKYAQAMLSGCVVAADFPTEHEEQLEDFVIPLDANWDIKTIDKVVQSYIEKPDLLEAMAAKALKYARQHFTNTRKILDAVRLVDTYREGKRGYDLPYGVALRCRSYWSDDSAWKPPWCHGLRGIEKMVIE